MLLFLSPPNLEHLFLSLSSYSVLPTINPSRWRNGGIQHLELRLGEQRENREGNTGTGLHIVKLVGLPEEKNVKFFLNYLFLLSTLYINFPFSGLLTSHLPICPLPRGGAFLALGPHIPSPHTTTFLLSVSLHPYSSRLQNS